MILIIDVNSESQALLTPEDNDSIKVHVNTIKPFIAYGGGQYIITSVKQMSTSSDFDNLPQDVKKCQKTEQIEECSNKEFRQLVVQAAQQCGCLPVVLNHMKNVKQVTQKLPSQYQCYGCNHKHAEV